MRFEAEAPKEAAAEEEEAEEAAAAEEEAAAAPEPEAAGGRGAACDAGGGGDCHILLPSTGTMVRIVRNYLGSRRRAPYYKEVSSGAKLTWSEPGCCRMGYTGHAAVVQPHGKSEANTSHRPKGAPAVTAAVGPFTARESETTSAPCRGDVGVDANGESNLRPYAQVPGNLTPEEAEARFACTGQFIRAL